PPSPACGFSAATATRGPFAALTPVLSSSHASQNVALATREGVTAFETRPRGRWVVTSDVTSAGDQNAMTTSRAWSLFCKYSVCPRNEADPGARDWTIACLLTGPVTS